jgi:hypothetical protein
MFNRIVLSHVLIAENSAKLIAAIARRVGFGSEYRGNKFSDLQAVSSRRAYPWADLPNLEWPMNVLSAQWTFFLNDEDGVALDSTSDSQQWIPNIFT